MLEEEQNHNQDTNTQSGGWGAFSAFKKTPQNNSVNTASKGFSSLTKLLIFLIPALLFATFYQYSVVKGSTFFGVSLRHNVDLERGLVGHWTFDGADVTTTEVLDMSGNGNDASLNNNQVVAGKTGQALEFDGYTGDNAIGIGGTDFDNLSAMTLSGWVKAIDYSGGRGFIFNKSNDYCADVGWCMYTYQTFSEMTFTVDYTGTNLYVGTPMTADDFNNWVHWTVTWDGSTNASGVHFYRNGVEVSNSTEDSATGSRVNDSASDLAIGGNGSDRGLSGSLDDARIYNRVLSAREIEALYKQGEGSKISVTSPTIPALESGLIGHWTFDGEDTNSSTVTDISGQGNDGTIYGTVPTVGKIGQAMRFDGDSSISLAVDPMASGNRTTCSWSKLLDDNMLNGTYQSILDSGYYTLSYYFIAGDHYISQTSNANNALLWQFPDSPVGKWHHICIIRPGGSGLNSSLYVDGVVAADGIDGNPQTFYDLTFGSSPVDTFTFTGDLDDVRIYDRLLSDSEITQLYNLGEGTKYNVTPTTYAPLENGLVGYWTFDGPDFISNAHDRSGQGNHGYVYGVATSSIKTPGKLGQGVSFDGVDDYIRITDPNAIENISTISVCAWIKPDAFVDGAIVAKGYVYYNWGFLLYSDQSVGFQRNRVAVWGDWQTDAGSIVSDEWQHVCVATDDRSSTANDPVFYINGAAVSVIESSTPSGSVVTDIGAAVGIGNLDGASANYEGSIDDVRVYNRLLSASEVEQIYNMGR